MGYILPKNYIGACIKHNTEMPKIFIETGTFKGGVPHRIMEMRVHSKESPILDDAFSIYYTIELDRQIYSIAAYRYRMFEEFNFSVTKDLIHSDEMDFITEPIASFFDGRLNLINNDSAIGLSELLPTISVKCAFWLDAHSGAQKYARGIDDVALFRELEEINKHPIKNHIIAIDDIGLFGTMQIDQKTGQPSCDYTNVSLDDVVDAIKSINPNYKIEIAAPYNMPMLLAVA